MTTLVEHAPLDRDGLKLRAGDVVRIIGVPTLDGMSPECVAESKPVFEYLKKTYKRIIDFNEYGLAEIEFRIPHEGIHSSHTVWIEPRLLKKKTTRT